MEVRYLHPLQSISVANGKLTRVRLHSRQMILVALGALIEAEFVHLLQSISLALGALMEVRFWHPMQMIVVELEALKEVDFE